MRVECPSQKGTKSKLNGADIPSLPAHSRVQTSISSRVGDVGAGPRTNEVLGLGSLAALSVTTGTLNPIAQSKHPSPRSPVFG